MGRSFHCIYNVYVLFHKCVFLNVYEHVSSHKCVCLYIHIYNAVSLVVVCWFYGISNHCGFFNANIRLFASKY